LAFQTVAALNAHVYEVRPRSDQRGLRHGKPHAISNAIGYAKHRSRSHNAVIRVYDKLGNVIATHEQRGQFQRVVKSTFSSHGASVFGNIAD